MIRARIMVAAAGGSKPRASGDDPALDGEYITILP